MMIGPQVVTELSTTPVRWTVAIPAFEPTELLRETLSSALLSLSRLDREVSHEIFVVDDSSTGLCLRERLQAWGFGGVPVYKNSSRVGIAGNWNRCVSLARGELIHILHQDDLVSVDFYGEMEKLGASCDGAGMLFCRSMVLCRGEITIGEAEAEAPGILEGWLARIASGQRVQCPSAVVRRSAYEALGGYLPQLRYVVDWEMWVRIATFFTVAYLPVALATYRVHSAAETQRVKSSAMLGSDFVSALSLMHRYLPGSSFRLAAQNYAMYSILYQARLHRTAGRHDLAAIEQACGLSHFGGGLGRRERFGLTLQLLAMRLRVVLSTSFQGRLPAPRDLSSTRSDASS
jgi:glycosyltransferase involved in cell wall biosynthesis